VLFYCFCLCDVTFGCVVAWFFVSLLVVVICKFMVVCLWLDCSVVWLVYYLW